MGYLLRAKYVLSAQNTRPTVLENTSVLVVDNKIESIGSDLDSSGHEVIEFPHHILMPGLVNTHTHAAMTLFRGYADDTPLNVWLNEYIWPMEAKLTAEQVNIGAKLAAVEAIMTGSTTLNSMYWYPEEEARAFSDIGVRLMTGPPIISGVSSLKDYEGLINTWHGGNNDLIRTTLNPHAPYTVTAEDMQSLHEYKMSYNSKNSTPLMLHTHLAEERSEMKMIRDLAERSGYAIPDEIQTATQYLNHLEVLDNSTIAAHSIETSPADLDVLKERQVGVATNSVSNLKLGNNLPDITGMLERKLKLGLGTDGPASNNGIDMFEAMKITALTQKGKVGNAAICSAPDVLRMATQGGAQVLGWEEIGTIAPGQYADVIAVDLKKPHLTPIVRTESLYSFLVYSVRGSDVCDVMINGKWRMRGRKLLDIDVEQITTEFYKQVDQLLSSSDLPHASE